MKATALALRRVACPLAALSQPYRRSMAVKCKTDGA